MKNRNSQTSSLVTVKALKFDNQIHRQWQGQLVKTADPLIVLEARFEEEIRHPLLGLIAPGTWSTEYYWLDRWYNVFHFAETGTSLCKFYCNINTPANFDGRVLSYIDLDIDILVAHDFTLKVVDEDEFALNSSRFNYPNAIRVSAAQAVKEVIESIEKRHFPFNE
jgi:protein associated with RNAse G/E